MTVVLEVRSPCASSWLIVSSPVGIARQFSFASVRSSRSQRRLIDQILERLGIERFVLQKLIGH
jgi:hypothetical protein